MLRFIFVLLILFILSSCKKNRGTESRNQFILNISLLKAKDNLKLILKKQEGYLSISLDSTLVKNQKATFKGNIESVTIYGIFIEGYKEGIYPIIEKGTITIKADVRDLSNAQISGTKLNNQLAAYKIKSKEISSKMNVLFHDFQKARAENNSKKLEHINQQMQKINKEKNTYSINFIVNNTNSFVASMVLHSLLINGDLPSTKIASLYNSLSMEVKNSQFSKDILYELQLDSIKKDSLNQFLKIN